MRRWAESGDARPDLIGRSAERRIIDRLIDDIHGGRSASLVLHGEPGIGKTALLDYAMWRAADCRLARAAGVESEEELAFGGLHQLCAPFLDQLDRLPSPQLDALGTAFGLVLGDPPDRFLIGLSVLNLLAEVAADRPLVCLIDDAQWLDRASAETLAFVARRLVADSVLLVFAIRDPIGGHILDGLERLRLRGLDDHHARALLATMRVGPFDNRIRDRIVAETQGNPLALLESWTGLDSAEPIDGLMPSGGQHSAGHIERGFLRRLAALPPQTRQLALIAAAEPIGDVDLLRRAASFAGIDVVAALAAVVDAELIRVDGSVTFRHPLVRSVAYEAGTPVQRQEAHRVLARATDPVTDPDRRAWHLARASVGPDETAAAALEASAGRARSRGGLSAAASFLDRAAQLTADPAQRGARTLAAAEARYQAGAFAEALELLDAADLSRMDDLGRTRAELVRGQIMFAARSASAGLPILLAAAGQLQTLDPTLARETYRDAGYAALTAGQLSSTDGLEQFAAAYRTMPRSPNPCRGEVLLDGLTRVITQRYSAGVPLLLRAVADFCDPDISIAEGLGWLPLASRMAHNGWDFGNWSVLSARLVDLARESGALSILPSALLLRLSNRVYAGDLAGADSLAAEALAIGEVTGSSFFAHYGQLVLQPWRGDGPSTRAAIASIRGDLALSGEGKVFTATEWATAVLHNGHGRYEDALAAARRGAAHPQELGLSTWSMIELVEAAVHVGRPEQAHAAIERIRELTEASGTDWALGTRAQVLAQISHGAKAEELFREAIDRLRPIGVRIQTARLRLLYGEWLRRKNRRVDARAQLGMAHEVLRDSGATAFADRARREYEATGGTLRRSPSRTNRPGEELTPQELQIALLAADGLSNPEIGARLFISPHTVEWHLRKVFGKLGIRSRRRIADRLPDQRSRFSGESHAG
ncbi:AAA family ATPase [Microlunatus elymi]|uniref:AAA family ATPase n=1 Tax=Microlunatus elymi TaxID=2596828 RepID=A0A516Q360_9ACTN|nr:LuxR family transcriptional regulator [Microlunatus elymi]QDP97860.1 AAA family ATPase [Microlunatus elymi]